MRRILSLWTPLALPASGASSRSRLASDETAPVKLPVLHGFTEDGVCTLCQLTEVDQPGWIDISRQSIVATAYRAMVCIMGLHLRCVTDKCLHSAQYTFSGLSDWLPSAASESWEKEFVILKVPLSAPEIFSFCLRESRVEVSLKVFPELTYSETGGARLRRPVAYVETQSSSVVTEPQTLMIADRISGYLSIRQEFRVIIIEQTPSS